MAGISWIKLSVNIFDDEKIKLIRSMPEGDVIILIWIQLLCLAGKTNDGGEVYVGQHMNYTDEMLATICNQPLNTVRLALKTFEQFEMINLGDDGLISIANWEKHQNIDGMEKVREQTRKRVAKYREKQKAIESCNVTVTLRNATDKNKNRIDKNKNRNNNSGSDDFASNNSALKTIVELWNSIDPNVPKIKALNAGTDRYKLLKARVNEYGLDIVVNAIQNIGKSQFLKGYKTDFTITFDWFIRPNNFIKVMEGNYDDKENSERTHIKGKKTAGQRFKERLEKRRT